MNLIFKLILALIVILLTVFLLERTTSLDLGLSTELLEAHADGDDEDEEGEEDEEEERITIVDGFKAVELDDEVIENSGIQYQKLYSIFYKPEFTAYAEVMNVAPLVTLKARYQDLLAERTIVQSALHNQNAILRRAEALHKSRSLSTRELEQIRAERALKVAELGAINSKVDNLVFEMKSNWGSEIAQIILEDNKQQLFEQLASHEASLILLSLLKDQSLDSEQQGVFISHRNQRDSAMLATFLDQANQISNPLYGESYYYIIKSRKVRAGMRIFAWVEESQQAETGLFIPDSAVVWYANEPWVYVKEDELFVRKPIGDIEKVPNGWLERRSRFDEVEIVVEGGQTILSEEFKWAIPDEDDD